MYITVPDQTKVCDLTPDLRAPPALKTCWHHLLRYFQWKCACASKHHARAVSPTSIAQLRASACQLVALRVCACARVTGWRIDYSAKRRLTRAAVLMAAVCLCATTAAVREAESRYMKCGNQLVTSSLLPGADAYNLFSEWELASQSLVAGHLMIVLLLPFWVCFTHAIRSSKDFLLLAGRGSTVSQNRRRGLNDLLEQRVYIIFRLGLFYKSIWWLLKKYKNTLSFATITIACIQQIVIIKYEKLLFNQHISDSVKMCQYISFRIFSIWSPHRNLARLYLSIFSNY